MNAPLVRTFGVLVVLFAVLAYFTARWTVIDRASLQDNPKNARTLLAQQKIARGAIYAADGSTLARSRASGPRRERIYSRVYPRQGLFAQTVGFDYLSPGFAGLERFYNGPLTGRTNGFGGALKRLQGKADQGDDLRTSLDPQAQAIATKLLAGRAGAVVALVPSTGRVSVMASSPGYDSNQMGTTRGRKARHDLKVGICGEHGGDPASVAFCHKVGMDYVSCSPYRVPIARLAAAQAAIAGTVRDKDG